MRPAAAVGLEPRRASEGGSVGGSSAPGASQTDPLVPAGCGMDVAARAHLFGFHLSPGVGERSLSVLCWCTEIRRKAESNGFFFLFLL